MLNSRIFNQALGLMGEITWKDLTFVQTFLKEKGKSSHLTDNLHTVFRSQICSMGRGRCGCIIMVMECHDTIGEWCLHVYEGN